MKVVFQGKIGDICKSGTFETVFVEIDLKGAVEGKTGHAKETSLTGKLSLKPIVANELKIGTTLRITIEEIQPTE